MTTEPLKISQSELSEFRDCRRRWYLHYYLNLQGPEKLSGALALGTNVHTALATYYSPNGTKGLAMGILHTIYEEAKEKSDAGTLPQVEKDAKLAKIMLEGYFDWVEENGIDANFQVLEAEAEIEYNTEILGTPIKLLGKRDAIGVNTETGIIGLLDHKTCTSLIDPQLDLNEQSRMYLLLQRLNGSTVVQNCWWNLLKKVQRTAKATPPFYAREEIYVSEDELRRFYIRVYSIIKDIINVRQRLDSGESHYSVCYPRPSRDCSWKCSFRQLCPLMDTEGEKAEKFIVDHFTVDDPYKRYENKGNE